MKTTYNQIINDPNEAARTVVETRLRELRSRMSDLGIKARLATAAYEDCRAEAALLEKFLGGRAEQ